MLHLHFAVDVVELKGVAAGPGDNGGTVELPLLVSPLLHLGVGKGSRWKRVKTSDGSSVDVPPPWIEKRILPPPPPSFAFILRSFFL